MRSVNLVVLVGNVGNDPEVRDAGESRVAGFSLATTYGWGKGDERQEKTEWHRIVAWNALADLAENFITKGSRLYIQGRIQYRSWETEEGETKYITEVVASEIVLLSAKKESGGPGHAERPAARQRAPEQEEGYDYGEGEYDEIAAGRPAAKKSAAKKSAAKKSAAQRR